MVNIGTADSVAWQWKVGRILSEHVHGLGSMERFFVFADEPSMELVYTSMTALEGSRDCPFGDRCRADCTCCCAAMVRDQLLIGGGGSCGDRVNSRDSAWPPCISCLHCNSCCEC